MTLSLSVLAVAFAAVGSVFVLASKAMPLPGSAEAASVRQSAALSRMAEDLQCAKHITEASAYAVTLVLDDRTGDGSPERYRYAWAEKPGSPLTLSINGSKPVTIAEDVQQFALSLTSSEELDRVPAGTYTSDEVLLFGHTSAAVSATRDMTNKTHGIGQVFTPALPSWAGWYNVTRARVRARQSGDAVGLSFVRVYDTSAGLPVGEALAEAEMEESALGTAYAWVDFAYTSPAAIRAGTAMALTIERKYDSVSGSVEYDAGGSDGLVTWDSNTDPWVGTAGQGMLAEVYGTYSVATPGVELTRATYIAAEVTLQVGAAAAQTLSVKLWARPGLDTAAWSATFDASPVETDLDGGGPDWQGKNSGGDGAFVGGRWSIDGEFETAPVHRFDQPVLVRATMGADSASRRGAALQINADLGAGGGVALTVKAGTDADGQHWVRVYDKVPLGDARIELQGLPGHLPVIRLLIAPEDDAVGLIVNGRPSGSFLYTPGSSRGLAGRVTLSGSSGGVFDEVSVHVGGTAVVTAE